MSTYAYSEVLDQVLNQVQHLTPDDQLRLVEDLVANIRRQSIAGAEGSRCVPPAGPLG